MKIRVFVELYYPYLNSVDLGMNLYMDDPASMIGKDANIFKINMKSKKGKGGGVA